MSTVTLKEACTRSVDLLKECDFVNYACIFSLDEQPVWTESEGFEVKQAEVDKIVRCFKEDLRLEAVALAGKRFIVIRKDDDGWLQLRQKSSAITVCTTTTGIVIAAHLTNTDEEQPKIYNQQLTMEVCKVREYLESCGF